MDRKYKSFMNSFFERKNGKKIWRSWPSLALYALLAMFIIVLVFNVDQGDGRKLTAKERTEVIDSVSFLLLENYVFPEVANKMALEKLKR